MIIFIFLSIIRDYIIWFIAFLNKWVFAIFTLFTFLAGGGLRYVTKELSMSLNIGTFEVIFSTNIQEAIGIINNTLLIHFVIGAIVGFIFIYIRFKYIKRASWHNILVLFIIL